MEFKKTKMEDETEMCVGGGGGDVRLMKCLVTLVLSTVYK